MLNLCRFTCICSIMNMITYSQPYVLNWHRVTLSALGKNFDKRHFKMFSYFSQKQVLTFHATCLHQRQFAWNVKICFLRIIRKHSINLSSAELAKRVVKDKMLPAYNISVFFFGCLPYCKNNRGLDSTEVCILLVTSVARVQIPELACGRVVVAHARSMFLSSLSVLCKWSKINGVAKPINVKMTICSRLQIAKIR